MNKEFAEQLADVFLRMDDAKAEAAAIIEAAKDSGVNVKALRKVAREMVMDSEKLAKKYEDEEQLDMFRADVGIFSRKGLEASEKAGSAHRQLGHKRVMESARELDKLAGSNIAGETERLTKVFTAKIVRDNEVAP